MMPIKFLVVAAGIGQLALVAGSLAIPRLLNWPHEIGGLRPLYRQLFWVYAAYIWAFNLAFGLVSALAPDWLLDGSPLAGAVTGFIALYWGARLGIQFAVFDRRSMPQGPGYRVAEAGLVSLFACLTIVYAVATAGNWTMPAW